MDGESIDLSGVNIAYKTNNATATDSDLKDLPIFSSEIQTYVKRVLVPKYSKQFRKDPDDLEQDFWIRVLSAGSLLKAIVDPRKYAAATIRNLCINQYRDTKLERKSTEPLEWDDGCVKDVIAKEQADDWDDIDRVEESPLTKKQKCELCKKVLKIIEPLPDEERLVVHQRLMVVPAGVIAKRIEKSRATVYRLSKEQKPVWDRIVNDLGVAALVFKDRTLKKALKQLIASSLRERGGPHLQA